MAEEDLEQFNLQTSHYGFSGTRMDELGASEYTLVHLVFDRSGSTVDFRSEMKKATDEVLKACQLSPRADNLMFRLVEFSDSVVERHGFRMLPGIDPSEYDCLLGNDGGITALFDATVNCVEATATYAKTLVENEIASVNGVIYILTDGVDNASSVTENTVKQALSRAIKDENLQSLTTVLIGINLEDFAIPHLQSFAQKAGISEFLNIGEASPKTLARLAKFVSKSISSVSQSLASGGSQAQSIVF